MAVAARRRPRAAQVGQGKAVKAGQVEDAEQRFGMLVKRAEQSMVRAKTTMLKPFGLTLAQYVALYELDAQPGVTAASLARTCCVSPQAMMVLLNSMEQQGLIARVPHVRHANVLELHMTDVGREAFHAARQRVQPMEARVLSAFTSRELATFRAHLSRFIDAFDEESNI